MAGKESVFDHYKNSAQRSVHRFTSEVESKASDLKKQASDAVHAAKEAVSTVSGTTAARALKKVTGGR